MAQPGGQDCFAVVVYCFHTVFVFEALRGISMYVFNVPRISIATVRRGPCGRNDTNIDSRPNADPRARQYGVRRASESSDMPVVAHRVTIPPPDAEPSDTNGRVMSMLSHPEREYVRGLKRRDRSDLVRLLSGGPKRPKGCADAPLRIQVLQSTLHEHVKMSIFNELRAGAGEKYVQWVRRAIQLPLDVMHPGLDPVHMPVSSSIARAKATMDAAITGHDAAKCEILKLVCQRRIGASCASSYSLGLEGPPGTGKTHMVRNAIAPALGRPLVSIPLGGATDVSYLLGSIYTYEGSREGRLAAALIESKCCNPVIHLDEVDKISTTDRGAEIAAVLIHLIDPSANASLRDRYFHGIDIDFSKCTFVFSYNDASKVNPILLDRIKRIHISEPTDTERVDIVSRHLVPRAQARLGTSLELSSEVMAHLISHASGGMRGVEKDVDHILASAQLCVECGTCDGELVGAGKVKVLDATGRVGVDFAKACAKRVDDVSKPPPSMYL